MKDYSKRLVEVEEILNYLPEEDKKKIPNNIIEYIKSNKDKKYIWKIDKSKKLYEQNLDKDTIAILSYINMEYLVNSGQKKFLNELYRKNN